jgi:glycosyltransferase involved in cell wall biosynthesis
MVTLDRLALAKESILSFARQTYPERELLIVTDGSPAFREALARFVDALNLRSQVRFFYPENTGHTLGYLRNLAMGAACGDILCQWDDDDINHPDRLLEQAQHLLQHNAAASFFADHLQFIEEQHAVCWIDWTLEGEVAGPDQLFPGSLMMHRDPRFRYPEEGVISRQGEDSVLLHMLYQNASVKPLIGAGHLYLYRFHGRNTFSREHHYNLANFRKPVAFLQAHQEILRSAVRSYTLPQPCYAVGREGPAFLFD